MLRIIRRNGQVVPFDAAKIASAIGRAFQETTKASQDTFQGIVDHLTAVVVKKLEASWHYSQPLPLENIQDEVEKTLMLLGHHQAARVYVLYREARHQARGAVPPVVRMQHHGEWLPLDEACLKETITVACSSISDVCAERILSAARTTWFDGITFQQLEESILLGIRTLIEAEPNYTYVAAKWLERLLKNEAYGALNLPEHADYATYFTAYLQHGIQHDLLDSALKTFDLNRITPYFIQPEQPFTYLGLQTLYDRYFLHVKGVHFELPQAFWMRVAMGLALQETDRETWAVQFYHTMASFYYVPSTPTLFNAGTLHPQLSSCYLSIIPDTLKGIFSAIGDNAMLSKFAGGLGNSWTSLRAHGAWIKGTNGQSLGPIPFMVVANATAVAVNQGGKRKGAVCGYLETFHRDIHAFLELRKNTGDDRRRTHDMNTAHWIPDLFMQRVMDQQPWTLFSPDDVPDLHHMYGHAFEEAYLKAEKLAAEGKLPHDIIDAVTLWRKMLSLLFETGHPWITFKDACNLRSPQQHVGVVHSSNLCTEITLNTCDDEIAVCNLGSVNLMQHLNADGSINVNTLKNTVVMAIRMLDNVIDGNYYPVPQARRSNLRHRPIGLGMMGFHDMLCAMGVSYASDQAVKIADNITEHLSYFAIEASSALAKTRGAYVSFEGSLWSRGMLPIDSITLLKANRRSEHMQMDTTTSLDWAALRQQVKTYGMRNSNVTAIAPTATIANIVGVSPSIDPNYQNLFVKSNLSGEFTIINTLLVKHLKQLKLWDDAMRHDLKFYNGSIQTLQRIPSHLKALFLTAFEIDPIWLVEAASRRQKWLCQSQSLNLYMAKPSGKRLHQLYVHAWIKGLKTTYYLRTLAASSVEKASVQDASLNAVSCQIDQPDCEACQ
jgi:ribonucleoside-diphosphate reductase alpha chain